MKKLLVLSVAFILPSLAFATDHDHKKGNLNDAEIAQIVVTANEADIANGKLAEEKATNEDVKAFAHRMITDHTDVNRQATELVTRLKVKPEGSMVSKGLKAEALAAMAKLKLLSGASFDKAYIENEIKLHKDVIDVADNKLMPSVKNEELKALLVKVRPALVSHLEHAQKIQSSLGGK
jgi:putative membrane protein